MPSASPAAHLRLPNLVTYVSIGAALVAAVCTAGPESRSLAGAALAVAVIADQFDGRFARLFTRTEEQKQFGVQVDSLADALAFGIAPVVALARLLPAMSPLERAAFVACGAAYAICAVTRLAFYNLTEAEHSGFIGVPTTMLGLFWSAWLLVEPRFVPTCIALAIGAFAMVSPVRIPRPGPVSFATFALVSLGLAITHIVR